MLELLAYLRYNLSMKQLTLLPSIPFPAGSWAREGRTRYTVVIWISDPVAAVRDGLARQLLEAGATSQGSQPLDGGLAVCLSCPVLLRSALLSLPRPRSQGSRSQDNGLPW
jgi:hypothetical protein